MKRQILLTFLCAAIALAEHYDASVFGALQWRSIGPQRGGRSITSAGSASRPNEYYFGAVGGGLWKTTDGGTTWRPVTDGQIQSSSVGAVAVAESNPDVVYLGMGETELRGNIMQGDGVYKSIDAGKTWSSVGLADTHAIGRLIINPKNPDVAFVAALGHPFGDNDERGIFRTHDGGKTWEKVLYKDSKTGGIDVEGIRILHHELPHPQQARLRPRLIAKLGLNLIPDLRQLLVAAQFLASNLGHVLFMRHAQAKVGALAVFQPEKIVAHHRPAAARFPKLARM